MIDPSIIFQRTQAGRDEIHNKSHGLTQSERLVLIMVDGVSSYREIRNKLPALTDERFDRGLQKLQKKELVLEVFMPVEGQSAEELERSVIDRFLQQDPLDPVTIMMRDPEEEFDLISRPQAPKPSQGMVVPPSAPASAPMSAPQSTSIPTLTETHRPVVSQQAAPNPGISQSVPTPAAEPAVDEHHAQLVDSLAEELRARKALRPPMPSPVNEVVQSQVESTPPPSTGQSALKKVHWGYWLIVAGFFLILGFALARVTQ